MKREDIKALAGNPYPNNFLDYKMLLISTLRAIREDSSLQVIDQNLFDDLMEYEKHPSLFSAFFFDHGIENESYFLCRKVIAKDKDGELLILDKGLKGQYIEVSVPINVGEPYIRFGLTYEQNQRKYNFFMTEYVYIDYYGDYRSHGNPRKMQTKSAFGWDTRYCDENGQSNLFTNISGGVNSVLDIFR